VLRRRASRRPLMALVGPLEAWWSKNARMSARRRRSGCRWTAEDTQISLTDPTTNELVVTPKKVAGLTQISNEAASDSNPAVADLARSVAKKVDAAFFGNTVTNGPSGLLSLSGVNVVDTGTVTLTPLDPFHEAKAAALADGAELSVFILAPEVALALSKRSRIRVEPRAAGLHRSG